MYFTTNFNTNYEIVETDDNTVITRKQEYIKYFIFNGILNANA